MENVFFVVIAFACLGKSSCIRLLIATLDTFDIVWLSRGCMERGDLEQAVKYMTLLRGEPKNMAKEWVREARLLLEARQVCDALMAHASAYGLEAFPTK